MSKHLSSTATAVTAFVVYLSATGCSQPPTAPSTTGGKSQLLTSWTVSGTVWIHGSGSPVTATNGRVYGWIDNLDPGSAGEVVGSSSIGIHGQYQLIVPAGTRRIRLQGPQFQPCGVVRELSGNTIADIDLVTDSNLLGASLPTELQNQGPALSGIVFEQTSQGPVPLANVFVQLRHFEEDGFLIAGTKTDANGRYALCRVPFANGLMLVTFEEGFAEVETYLGTNVKQTQDVEMKRQLPIFGK